MFKKSAVLILHFAPSLHFTLSLHFALSLRFTPGPQSAVHSPQSTVRSLCFTLTES